MGKQPRREDPHLVITDSGLGGLAVCAQIEGKLRRSGAGGRVRITYFNAWPDRRCGYNDLPDMQARARVFDRALESMERLRPDRILIACNTLSILYGLTEFSRRTAVHVSGIIDAGIDMFYGALIEEPASSILLLGTRTTIESGVHRDRLIGKGIPERRIAAVSCHGLATAVENDPDGPAANDLIEKCSSDAGRMLPEGDPINAGLCCTHYGFIAGKLRATLELRTGRRVRVLDPNGRLADESVPAEGSAPGLPGKVVSVKVVSKVPLGERKRRILAGRIEEISPATAQALLSYTHAPDLFLWNGETE